MAGIGYFSPSKYEASVNTSPWLNFSMNRSVKQGPSEATGFARLICGIHELPVREYMALSVHQPGIISPPSVSSLFETNSTYHGSTTPSFTAQATACARFCTCSLDRMFFR